jgi:hypothetical protein
MPPAAYFSLQQGKILATSGAPFARFAPIAGPPLSETWARLERTVDRVETMLRAGRVPVTGVRRSIPILESIGLDEQQQKQHLSLGNEGACKYCGFGALCGRDWETIT